MKKKTLCAFMKKNGPIALFLSKDLEKIDFLKKTIEASFTLVALQSNLEVLDWVKNAPVELIILEKKALQSSLEEICKSIKKISKGKQIPLLLLSNTLKKLAVLEALNAGISDFIHEPLDEMEIQERLLVCSYSKQTSKKVGMVQNKIKSTPLIPRNAKGLLEKTFLQDKTLKIISQAKQGSLPLSVLMIHLDAFGHLQEILKEPQKKETLHFLEKFFQKRLRKYDSLLAEGPGQYLILLPKTSQSAAQAIAEEIRKEVSETTIPTKDRELLVTVSIAVISFEKELSQSAKDFEQFDLCLERVKKSLTRAQKKGNTLLLNKTI